MLPIQSRPEPPARIFIACNRCKARKRKCDGGTPKCSNCAAHDAECDYAPVRKTRGPGKRKRGNDDAECDQEGVINFTTHPESEKQVELMTSRPPAMDISNSGSSSLQFSQTYLGMRERPTIFPDFLLPGTFNRNLAIFKSQLEEASAARRFFPLIPVEISRRLIGHSFPEVIEEYQFISLESFARHFEIQYAVSTVGPAEDAARWALVNAIIALSMRFKIAAGSEHELYPVIQSCYQNATMVVHQLILQDPSIVSVQALLAMALFSRGIPDPQAFVMLTTNASRQFEIFSRRWFGSSPMLAPGEEHELPQVCEVSNKLSQEASVVVL
ncbi:hypothetical protein F5Y07DRAFT_399308 [Xylaria sp. FL0933]|nr:hypothetical protein F5Y07DRAFT_399308 [Xylaria sp. FL0933]